MTLGSSMLAVRCRRPYNYLTSLPRISRGLLLLGLFPRVAGDPGRDCRHRRCRRCFHHGFAGPRRRPLLASVCSNSCNKPAGRPAAQMAPWWFVRNSHTPLSCPNSSLNRHPSRRCNRRRRVSGKARAPRRPRPRNSASPGGMVCSAAVRSSRAPGKTAVHPR